jgi:RNA polymerase sigma-70 factor, ECF subfamily
VDRLATENSPTCQWAGRAGPAPEADHARPPAGRWVGAVGPFEISSNSCLVSPVLLGRAGPHRGRRAPELPRKWSRRVPEGAWQQEVLELLEAHGGPLMALLRRLCGNCHDADDVFQETAARVWRSFASRPRLRSPRAWVMTIGYRAFLDSLARKPRHAAFEDAPDDRIPSPGQTAENMEQCDRVQAAIAGLPQPIREVVALHYVAGLTLRQTAAAMGISPSTAKSRLNTALNKLRSVME